MSNLIEQLRQRNYQTPLGDNICALAAVTIEALTQQNLVQHERIRLLEEWMYEIIETWHCGDIKPEQLTKGKFLLWEKREALTSAFRKD